MNKEKSLNMRYKASIMPAIVAGIIFVVELIAMPGSGGQSLNKQPVNYSLLNEIEKNVYKRAYPELSIAKRLDRLEIKLFGQNNPKMSTGKRIERLQQTLGIVPSQPMAQMPNSIMVTPNFDMPDFGDPAINQMHMQMAQIFKQMEQMQQGGMSPGFSMPGAIPPPSLSPRATPPRTMPPHTVPQPRQQIEKLPSYNDPNFI